MTLMLGDPVGMNRDSVHRMIQHICPEAKFQVDADGVVIIKDGDFYTHEREALLIPGCNCLRVLIASDKIVIIVVRQDLSKVGGGRTDPANADRGTNGKGSDAVVNIENRNRYRQRKPDIRDWIDVPDWVILAHELCGHALPLTLGNHPEWRPGKPGYRQGWHRQSQLVKMTSAKIMVYRHTAQITT